MICVLLEVLPEVVVDHVAEFGRQCEELEEHLGGTGGWH
jgi:hypothetical protein